MSPFETHFGRTPQTELSNILTKPSQENLSNKTLKYNCLDKETLWQNVLSREELCRRDDSLKDN